MSKHVRNGLNATTWVAGAVFVLSLAACWRQQASVAASLDLVEGERIYQAECAACHGAKLQGQPDWRTRRADGKLPAPPHDASGHTWHHPMEQLIAMVKFGMVPPNAPTGYVSDMPAYAGKLSDRQIQSVLAYIENQWPAEVRSLRAERLKKP